MIDARLDAPATTVDTLHVAQVCPWERQGGGEQIAGALFRGLRERGHRSTLIVGTKSSNDPDVIELPHAFGRSAWFKFWQATRGRFDAKRGSLSRRAWRAAGWLAEPGRFADWMRGVEDFRFPGTNALLQLDPPPDLLHLHNLHGGYFDLRLLPRISSAIPTVLTLHDAWLLSGHCAHAIGCERWRTGCGACPDLTIYPGIRRDATAYNWRRKQAIFGRSRVYVVTPSQWLMRRIEQSMLAPAMIEGRVIPNGVDLTVFRPQPRAAARAALGLPVDATILLFAANGVRQNPFKDYRTLREAVGRLAARSEQARNIVFLAVGEEGPPEKVGEAVIRFVPHVSDPAQMARYYSAANLYVHAALADTFPGTVLEALACGAPVVATAVGGIPEQVRTSEGENAPLDATGVLAPPRDAAALCDGIARLLDDASLRDRLSENAARDARQRFDVRLQIERHLDWYREIFASQSVTVRRDKALAT